MIGPDSGGRAHPVITRRPTATAAANAAADHLAGLARAAIDQRGEFTLAVSGGRSPWAMLAALVTHDLPWTAVTVFQVDERIAPDDHPDRNLTGLRAALGEGWPGAIVPMPVTESDLPTACARYARALPPLLDAVHLGLGADGHTASLIPGDPVLAQTSVDVALTEPYQGRRRMTLTYPRIARSRHVLWLVTGAEKATALQRLLDGDPGIPASHITSADQHLFTDLPAPV